MRTGTVPIEGPTYPADQYGNVYERSWYAETCVANTLNGGYDENGTWHDGGGLNSGNNQKFCAMRSNYNQCQPCDSEDDCDNTTNKKVCTYA